MADKALISELRDKIDNLESEAPSVTTSKAPPQKRSRQSRKNAEEVDFKSPEEALSKIVALVNVSDRSEYTIRDRLSRAGFEQLAIDQAVERAKSYGFINDYRFADILIRSRLSQGKGTQGIVRELATQKIDIDEVPGWPEEYEVDEDLELERALALLERKPPRSKNRREGAYRKLMGSGYSSSIASSAARIWAEQQADSSYV